MSKKFVKSAKFSPKQASDLARHLIRSRHSEGFVFDEGPDAW